MRGVEHVEICIVDNLDIGLKDDIYPFRSLSGRGLLSLYLL